MFIRELKDCEEFIAGDNCTLREILHPEKECLSLRYSLAHAIVKSGDTTWQHRLKASEVYYILEGEGVMHIGNETAPVRPGSTVYIPPLATQCITNSGNTDLKFICIVDPAWRKDDEEMCAEGTNADIKDPNREEHGVPDVKTGYEQLRATGTYLYKRIKH